jgi:hypothetical protein
MSAIITTELLATNTLATVLLVSKNFGEHYNEEETETKYG